MRSESFESLCIFHILDGLCDGLSHFSQSSRAALIYAFHPDDPIRICDPQNLLRGHEPKLSEIYLKSDAWKNKTPSNSQMNLPGHSRADNPQLAGLISYGGMSRPVYYQMWFTEHHPDMCSIGPTQRWLEQAVRLLSQDISTDSVLCLGTSGYVLQECTKHAVRDYIVDQRNLILGWDTQLRIYPTLDSILEVSKTLEEGAAPRGNLAYVEPNAIDDITFLARFPREDQPMLASHKHVRKLLQSVEHAPLWLISDGNNIMGVARGDLPPGSIIADFRGNHGFVRLDDELVCSFSDGNFRSSTRKANLVQIEELLLETELDADTRHELHAIVSSLVHSAGDRKHGCTLVLDFQTAPRVISGQYLEQPLDLRRQEHLELAKALSKVDGALLIDADCHLRAFACLLDGRSVVGENRARGARYNSALRFTCEHDNLCVVVVSSDRPVSIINKGVELTASCVWKPLAGHVTSPPTLKDWVESS